MPLPLSLLPVARTDIARNIIVTLPFFLYRSFEARTPLNAHYFMACPSCSSVSEASYSFNSFIPASKRVTRTRSLGNRRDMNAVRWQFETKPDKFRVNAAAGINGLTRSCPRVEPLARHSSVARILFVFDPHGPSEARGHGVTRGEAQEPWTGLF